MVHVNKSQEFGRGLPKHNKRIKSFSIQFRWELLLICVFLASLFCVRLLQFAKNLRLFHLSWFRGSEAKLWVCLGFDASKTVQNPISSCNTSSYAGFTLNYKQNKKKTRKCRNPLRYVASSSHCIAKRHSLYSCVFLFFPLLSCLPFIKSLLPYLSRRRTDPLTSTRITCYIDQVENNFCLLINKKVIT